jgi:phospholipid/cholesterol/gamma-HCH transport system substrate-binding protein
MNKIRITWQRVRTVPGLKSDLVLVVGLLVLGLAVSANLLTRYHLSSPFADKFVFSAEFDQAPAIQLAARQEVRIAGVPVGKIVDAKVTDRGTARLIMEIDPQHKVYANARVIIRSKTPLNIMYVALDPGSKPAAPLAENATVPAAQTERVLQPYELFDQLDTRARAALTDLVEQSDIALAKAPRRLPDGLDATSAALQSFKPVARQLEQRRENVRRLVTALSRISTAAGSDDKRLASLAASLEETLVVVAGRDKELSASLAQLPGVTAVLRRSMTSAAELTDELNPTLKSLHAASSKLPTALRRLGKTVDEADDLIRAARPVVAQARPVLSDLRPLIDDVDSALTDLSPVVSTLPDATARIVPWLDDLGAFVYQTSSAFGLADVNGGLGRASVVVKLSDPTGGNL